MSLFKKRTVKTNQKRRAAASDDEDEDEDETVVVKKAATSSSTNPMIQQTTNFTKAKSRVNHDSDSDDEKKKRDKLASPLVDFRYKSSRSGVVSGVDDQGATATVEIDTPHDQDGRAVFERSLKAQESGEAGSGAYTGKDNYTMYVKPTDKPSGSAAASKGPVRAPNFLRATTRWDYAPDICKDYKETGFCGFGDSCKFLHDRSDYKFGWQLENEYTAQHKHGATKPEDDTHKYEISSDEDEFPFKCIICRESYTNPVMTKCRHYFCEKCAIAQCKKSMRCYACGTDTRGVFNPAKELVAKLTKANKVDEPDFGDEPPALSSSPPDS